MTNAIRALMIVVVCCTIFVLFEIKENKKEQPKLVVFQACLDKAEKLSDETICDCAKFVGHPNWCNGDIKY